MPTDHFLRIQVVLFTGRNHLSTGPNTFQAAADLIRSHVSPKTERHSGRKERNLFFLEIRNFLKMPPDGASFLELLRTLIIYVTLLIVNYSVSNLKK
jgi:hypothetical protein